MDARHSERWQRHHDLIRTQIQETGRVRLSFLTLLDLGIDRARGEADPCAIAEPKPSFQDGAREPARRAP